MKVKTIVLLISTIFIAYMGYRYPILLDLTFNRANTLSQASQKILAEIDKPFSIELHTIDPMIRDHVKNIVSLFQQKNKEIKFKVTVLPLEPGKKMQFGLQSNDTILFSYQGAFTAMDVTIHQFNEQIFRKILTQFIQDKEHWVVFLSGHGEQDPSKDENRHFHLLTDELKKIGSQVAPLYLGETTTIPSNAQLLVIADPKTTLLPQETTQILKFLKDGNNLLWLVNPTSQAIPELANALGIDWQTGTIHDTNASRMGAPQPTISIITKYPEHPITQQLDMLTVFPESRPIDASKSPSLGWEVKPLLLTHPETTLIEGDTTKPGPFTLGVALTKGKQRVIVMGNTHFLSNAGIHNYGNLALSQNIFHWLNEADRLIDTTERPLVDATFTETTFSLNMIRYGFPYGFSLIFLLLGWGIKRLRHQKHGFS